MNKFGLIVSLSLIATSAFATSGGEGNNTGCNGQGNENSPCAPDTPAATPTNVTSTAIAANLNKISNKNTNLNANSNKNSNSNLNKNSSASTATGGNAESNATGGNATGGSVGNTTATSGSASTIGNVTATTGASTSGASASANGAGANSNNVDITQNYQSHRAPVTTAYATSLTSGVDTCTGSMSGGVQTQVVGLSLGKTNVDKNCILIKQVQLLSQLGIPEAACFRARAGEEGKAIDDAMKAAGVNCMDYKYAVPVTPPVVVTPPVAVLHDDSKFVTKDELKEHEVRITRAIVSK